MNKILATSLTTGLFLIIGISGAMMFLNFFGNYVKSLHEYLGFAFLIAVALHLFYNWKSMKRYFIKRTFYVTLMVTVLVSSVFILQSSQQATNPKKTVLKSVINAPIKKAYDILEITNAKEKLEKENISITNAKSILELAKANNTSPFRIISILTQGNSK